MKPTSFEKALEKLESIVEELEKGEIPLEDSLKKYEEGMILAKFCQQKLLDAEKKLKKLVKNSDGNFELELLDES